MLRLSPLFPFNLLNYGLGLSQVSLKDYVLGTLGIVPGTMMYVYVGSFSGQPCHAGGRGYCSRPSGCGGAVDCKNFGLIATIAVTVYITRIAQQALKTTLADSDTTVPNGSP